MSLIKEATQFFASSQHSLQKKKNHLVKLSDKNISICLIPWHIGARRKDSCLGERKLCVGGGAGWWPQALLHPVGSSRTPGVIWAHGGSSQSHPGLARQLLWHLISARMTVKEKEGPPGMNLKVRATYFSISMKKYSGQTVSILL